MKRPVSNRLLFDTFYPLKCVNGSHPKLKRDFLKIFKDNLEDLPLYPICKRVSLYVEFHFRSEYLWDLDNLLKTLFDSLQKSEIINNDKLVRKVNAVIIDNSLIEGIRISLNEFNKNLY